MKLGRRELLATGTLGSLAMGLELASIGGAFDHRRSAAASAPSGWSEQLERVARRPGTWLVHVGHSTHLICRNGVRLLTDPWFHDPAFGALEHTVPPPVAPDAIGPLDAILVSHDHPDHADLRALDRLDKRASVLTATGELAARVRALGFGSVHVLRPGDTAHVAAVPITATPALHDVPEIGFVIGERRACLYFAGDTAFFPELAELRERFEPRAAILPIDGTRLVGSHLTTMTPADAARAADVLGVSVVVPSHAEARFSDPFVEHVLTRSVAGGAAELGRRIGARCVPLAGGDAMRVVS